MSLKLSSVPVPGVLKFGFGRDVPLQNLKVDPYKYHFFQEKITHSYTNRPNFGPTFEQIYQFFPKFS